MFTLAFFIFMGLLTSGEANAFRGSDFRAQSDEMRVEKLRATMLDELMSALGTGNRVTQQRLAKLEEAARPTFLAMPKNENGNLDHAGVRYVLHRLFVERHAMYVKGLDPAGESWSQGSPVGILEDRVPSYVQSLFEEHLSGRGLGIHEVAILAATLEHLIHDEAVQRLKATYNAHHLALDNSVTKQVAEELIDTYMMIFLMGNHSVVTYEDVKSEKSKIRSAYPNWKECGDFAREVMRDVTGVGTTSASQDMISFNTTSQIVEEIGERYGKWQDQECKDLKRALVQLEDAGTGRVKLADFYGKGLDGAWQFTESVEYLRQLGALDESDPSQKSVIISNYINAPSNCLASASMYSVCCLNECEALLGQVEREVAGPEATPERLVAIAERLPSATVTAPRTLSESLIGLLKEVASHHGGQVPLHGRLFAQWMHHVYPRECPYPHEVGTTKPATMNEIKTVGTEVSKATVSVEDMKIHAANRSITAETAPRNVSMPDSSEGGRQLMWTMEEELIVKKKVSGFQGLRRVGRIIFFVAALLSALFGLRQSLWSAVSALGGSDGPRKRHATPLPFAQKSHMC